MSDRCKKGVMHGFHLKQCKRSAVKDGFCNQHHPDNVAERDRKRMDDYRKQQENSPLRVIARLRAEVASLKEELASTEAERKMLEDNCHSLTLDRAELKEQLAAAKGRVEMLEEWLRRYGADC